MAACNLLASEQSHACTQSLRMPRTIRKFSPPPAPTLAAYYHHHHHSPGPSSSSPPSRCSRCQPYATLAIRSILVIVAFFFSLLPCIIFLLFLLLSLEAGSEAVPALRARARPWQAHTPPISQIQRRHGRLRPCSSSPPPPSTVHSHSDQQTKKRKNERNNQSIDE